eukprot:TRINITY_DN44226_c0_g1_i2.p1 TRINITY_DN44226_c0_g1~~TRINITY_DN44226_c0_g1_i2.p1  ORF type:complete len:173 (+),score=9.41 TRINITY_DN44226_c0_g1_i2:438-956(+)
MDLLRQNLQANASSARPEPVTVPCGWGSPVPREIIERPVDVVVGADIAYLRPMLPPLVATVLQLMSESTVFILAQSDHRGVCIDDLEATFNPHIVFQRLPSIQAMDETVHILIGRLGPGVDVNVWLHEWQNQAWEETCSYDHMLEQALGVHCAQTLVSSVEFGPHPRPPLPS